MSRAFDKIKRAKLIEVLRMKGDSGKLIISTAFRNIRGVGLTGDLRPFYKGGIEETIYAYEVDLISEDKSSLIELLELAPEQLSKWFLYVNKEKTDIVEVTRSNDKIDERWRHVRKLGSLLGDSKDIARRKILVSAAIHKLWKEWLSYKSPNVKLRTRLYNAFVRPVLMYKFST